MYRFALFFLQFRLDFPGSHPYLYPSALKGRVGGDGYLFKRVFLDQKHRKVLADFVEQGAPVHYRGLALECRDCDVQDALLFVMSRLAIWLP